MEKKFIPRSVGVHDGAFHADEVTACALLLLFNLIDSDQIYRTRDESLLAQCEYVCDVGGIYQPAKKRFDHHQSEYTGELSSAGMVLAYLRDQQIISPAIYDFLNHSLVWGVDAHDNGRMIAEPGVSTFSHIVSNFAPPMYDAPTELQNETFSQALMFVRGHLKRLLERYHYIQSYKQKVADAMALQEEALFFEEGLPWMDSFFDLGGETHPALFIVMPAGKHWKLRAIPPTSEERMKVRKPLPQKWAGLLDEDLKRVSGISGAIFCHKGRFVSVWETKEDAFKALDYVLKQEAR